MCQILYTGIKIQSAKMILVHPKCKIIVLLSNCLFSNIVIALNPDIFIHFWYQFFDSFLDCPRDSYCSFNYHNSDSKKQAIKNEEKKTIQKGRKENNGDKFDYGRAIALWEAIEKSLILRI